MRELATITETNKDCHQTKSPNQLNNCKCNALRSQSNQTSQGWFQHINHIDEGSDVPSFGQNVSTQSSSTSRLSSMSKGQEFPFLTADSLTQTDFPKHLIWNACWRQGVWEDCLWTVAPPHTAACWCQQTCRGLHCSATGWAVWPMLDRITSWNNFSNSEDVSQMLVQFSSLLVMPVDSPSVSVPLNGKEGFFFPAALLDHALLHWLSGPGNADFFLHVAGDAPIREMQLDSGRMGTTRWSLSGLPRDLLPCAQVPSWKWLEETVHVRFAHEVVLLRHRDRSDGNDAGRSQECPDETTFQSASRPEEPGGNPRGHRLDSPVKKVGSPSSGQTDSEITLATKSPRRTMPWIGQPQWSAASSHSGLRFGNRGIWTVMGMTHCQDHANKLQGVAFREITHLHPFKEAVPEDIRWLFQTPLEECLHWPIFRHRAWIAAATEKTSSKRNMPRKWRWGNWWRGITSWLPLLTLILPFDHCLRHHQPTLS